MPFRNSAFYLHAEFLFHMIRSDGSSSNCTIDRCDVCCAVYASNIMCIALIVCPSLYQYVVNVQIETKTSTSHANTFSAFHGSIISHVTTQVCQEHVSGHFEEQNRDGSVRCEKDIKSFLWFIWMILLLFLKSQLSVSSFCAFPMQFFFIYAAKIRICLRSLHNRQTQYLHIY